MRRCGWSVADYLVRILETKDEIEDMKPSKELDKMLIYLSELQDELAELEN